MTTPGWWRRSLAEGDRGGDVWVIRRVLGLDAGADFDMAVAASVRGSQLAAGIPPTGVVDAATAAVLGDPSWAGNPPGWWAGDVTRDSPPEVVAAAREALGYDREGGWTRVVERAVRRFQSDAGIPPTGVIDSATAVALRLR